MLTKKNNIKKMSIAGIIVLLILSIVIVAGCTQEKKTAMAKLINPPIPGLEAKYKVFQIDAAQGGTFSLPTGTTITIPQGALVDSSGKPLQCKVDLQYREFHDAVSLLLSGIPMSYEKSGIKQNFQTAGMFDLNASQNGKKVFIDPDKKIIVKMASYEAGNDYNFWWLDEKNESWEFLDRRDAEVNPKKEEMKRIVEKLRPGLKFPMDDKYFCLSYRDLLDIYYKNDWSQIDKNYQKPVIDKKAKEYGLTWTSIYSYTSIQYQGNYHRAALMVWKNISDKPMPKWVFNDKPYNSANFTRINGNTYRMNIENDKGAKYSLTVEVVMPLKALLAFSPEYWKKNYEEAMAKIYEEEKRLKLEADVFRTFEVSQFGIYNYDKFLKEENRVEVMADFLPAGRQGIPDQNLNKDLSETDMIFCLPEDNKTVIKYPKGDWSRVALLPGNKIRFMSVIPGSRIAIFSSERYLKINFDSLKSQPKPAYKFTMISQSQAINSEDDLRKILGI
ncbi:MAG: hypothetical protein HY958_04395 [Bacteroidia bacterium]|nr:hypothetical protein [Bacteroidia bacterium]